MFRFLAFVPLKLCCYFEYNFVLISTALIIKLCRTVPNRAFYILNAYKKVRFGSLGSVS
jgi:hypothetical protein